MAQLTSGAGLWQGDGMDFAEALVAEELWGWPVDVLDQLWALHDRAWAGEISLEKWREQDAALRAGLPPVDHEEVGEFRLSWIMEGLRDAPEDILRPGSSPFGGIEQAGAD
jgi:hypothetical protein